MVDVSALSGAATSPSQSGQSLVSFSKDFDSFLLLLTQQLKNQDPLKPMDATEFTTQLVQFTSVEQQIRQNQNLESMITLQHSTLVSSMVSYLGKTVDTVGSTTLLTDGAAAISYTLPAQAKTVMLEITNGAGEVLRSAEVEKTKGDHIFNWDGKSNAGTLLPDGAYNVKFTAVDGVGNPIAVGTSSSGKVTNVEIENGLIILTVGSVKIPLSEVKSVRDTPVI